MGKYDISVKPWLRNKQRFADLFNGAFFGGEKIVRPDELSELNVESDYVLQDRLGNKKYVQRYRDLVMDWNGLHLRAILAIELQDKVHYAMPVRNIIMDALTYTDQMRVMWEDIPELNKKKWLVRMTIFLDLEGKTSYAL